MTGNKIIPFGKYGGQDIDQIKVRDPKYFQWLMAQDWFLTKFQHLVLEIEPSSNVEEETPEHNAMQVRFLDQAYRTAFVKALGLDRRLQKEACEELKKSLPSVKVPKRRIGRVHLRYSYAKVYAEEHRAAVRLLWEYRAHRREAMKRLSSGELPFEISVDRPRFEVGGWDVVFNVKALFITTGITDYGRAPYNSYREEKVVRVELKPSMGDDFPSVLRQIKRQFQRAEVYNTVNVLLVGQYTGRGASLEQVRQMFGLEGIWFCLAENVEAELAGVRQ